MPSEQERSRVRVVELAVAMTLQVPPCLRHEMSSMSTLILKFVSKAHCLRSPNKTQAFHFKAESAFYYPIITGPQGL